LSIDAQYFERTYPYDPAAFTRTHLSNWLHPLLTDPLAALNQQAIEATDMYSGVEAWDYQNPYVWQSRGLLTTATLDTAYGIPGDSSHNVALNVLRTGVPLKGP
jgi:hypothetical protein